MVALGAVGYLAAVAFLTLLIRAASRETERVDRFARLVDEDDDER